MSLLPGCGAESRLLFSVRLSFHVQYSPCPSANVMFVPLRWNNAGKSFHVYFSALGTFANIRNEPWLNEGDPESGVRSSYSSMNTTVFCFTCVIFRARSP